MSDHQCCHDPLGPHWATEAIDVPNCCHTHAEDLPANTESIFESVTSEPPLPGWTAQTGNAAALPVEICEQCGAEIDPTAVVHEHTVLQKGNVGEKTLLPDGSVIYRHYGDEVPFRP